ncbi:MAG: sugar ABC transporter substrate-binding protein [Acetanaerobacterium sp.]
MLKKVLTVSVLAAMVLSLVSGCAGNNDASSTPASADGDTPTSEPVSITFWDGSWSEDRYAPVAEAFAAEYPNITVNAEFQVDDGMSDKYLLALKSGTAPDVLACAVDWVTSFGNAGLLAPIDDYVAADSVDIADYVDGAVRAATIDGNLYGLPFRSETYGLFYNKDLLAAAGYTAPPETWAELLEIAKATTKDDVAGFGLVGKNYGNLSFQYITMLRSSGGEILNADNTKCLLDSDVAIETANYYVDMYLNDKVAPASTLENDNTSNRNLFAAGKIAMYLSGVYDVDPIKEANPELNFASAMVPHTEDASTKTILGGWSVAIAESSDKKDAAWDFVKFLTTPEMASIYSNTFPGRKSAATMDKYQSEEILPHLKALDNAVALPAIPQMVQIRQTIFDSLSSALAGSMTAEEAMVEATAKINTLLEG